jgi:hypothetical protein
MPNKPLFFLASFASAAWLALFPQQVCAQAKQSSLSKRAVPDQYLLYEQVAAALRTGSAVVYTVPVETNPPALPRADEVRDCASAPPISKAGIQQARAISVGVQRLGAPWGAIGSSTDCVAMTTATYIKANPTLLVRITAELDPPLLQRQRGTIDDVIAQLLRTFFNVRWRDHTTLIVGSPQLPETTIHPVLTDLKPGESAIFVVPEPYQFNFIAKLNTQQWQQMTNYLAPPAARRSAKRASDKRSADHQATTSAKAAPTGQTKGQTTTTTSTSEKTTQ